MEGTGSGGSVGIGEVGLIAGLGTGALEGAASEGDAGIGEVGLAGAGAECGGALSSSTSPGGSPGG